MHLERECGVWGGDKSGSERRDHNESGRDKEKKKEKQQSSRHHIGRSQSKLKKKTTELQDRY